MRRDTEISISD